MRKISEMYRRSGGTSYTHECKECAHYADGKNPMCELHGGEPPAVWKPTYIACKYFSDGKESKTAKTTDNVTQYEQLNLFNFM